MNAALASAAFKHHAEPTGLIHSRRIGMMHECSAGELLARAAFMRHDDEGHSILKRYAVLKGLMQLPRAAEAPGPRTSIWKQTPSSFRKRKGKGWFSLNLHVSEI